MGGGGGEEERLPKIKNFQATLLFDKSFGQERVIHRGKKRKKEKKRKKKKESQFSLYCR